MTVHTHASGSAELFTESGRLNGKLLRDICLQAGADDAGFVELDRPAIADEKPHILRAFPATRTLLSIVVRMNRENVRSPARSIANNEFHHSGDEVDEICREVVTRLERAGIRAMNPPMAFPMEADRWMTGRMWVVSHKPVAVAAGMGHMGINRNVIHPKFGNFILLGTILLADDVDTAGRELDFNPCIDCKLCVAACPVGAISGDGHFNAASCYTHNYKEFMGGFNDWVENVVESRDRVDYRGRVKENETLSTWQSLTYGANYKAAYCMAVCPAGEDVLPLFQLSKKAFRDEILKPLVEKEEALYVVPGSDAEAHARKRFPHKSLRHVRNTLRPRNIATLIEGMPWTFQRGQARDLDATYRFTFTGRESAEVTVCISAGKITVTPGLVGHPTLAVVADSETWLGYLAGEKSLPWALLTRRVRLRGNPKWLLAFGRCFPR